MRPGGSNPSRSAKQAAASGRRSREAEAAKDAEAANAQLARGAHDSAKEIRAIVTELSGTKSAGAAPVIDASSRNC